MDKIEFSRGDKVTYKPYDTPHLAMVKEVQKNPMNGNIEYQLVTRPGYTGGVKAVTTGRSIVESDLYEEYDPDTHG